MKYSALLFTLMLFGACEKESATSGSLHARLEAAKTIGSQEPRDEALAKVAIDAAEAKEADVATQAVQKIGDQHQRDNTARTCALTLSKNGEAKAATIIAQGIGDQAVRDNTLKEVAKGQ